MAALCGRYGRPQDGRGHGAQTSLVPVEKLESVELQFGGSGAQYGSDALAGVVELNTHRDLTGPRRMALMLTGRTGGPGQERGGMARVRAGELRIGFRGDAFEQPDHFGALVLNAASGGF